jgi:hypothetical protein
MVNPCDDLDEGGFARAVFSNKRMDFPVFQIKINIVQSPYSGKRFGNVAQFKNIIHGIS